MDDRHLLDNLVECAKQGDRSAYEDLFRQTHRALFKFALSDGLTYDEASDICQDTYVRAWSALPGLKSTSSFVAWLYRIARNQIKDYRKYRARHPEIASETDQELASPDKSQMQNDLEQRELIDAINCGLSLLPDNQRIPIILHHIHGRSVTEIAQLLQVSYGTILSRMARGRSALARGLESFRLQMLDSKKENANVL